MPFNFGNIGHSTHTETKKLAKKHTTTRLALSNSNKASTIARVNIYFSIQGSSNRFSNTRFTHTWGANEANNFTMNRFL